MDLEYKDYFSVDCKKKVRNLYETSFPKQEKFPFWILKCCSKQKNVLFNSIFYQNELIGLEYILKYENSVYLMYFAINEDKRSMGYGTEIIKKLAKDYDNVILSIERANSSEKLRRKQFYLKNGFYSTNVFYIDAEVEYEILCTNKNFKVSNENLNLFYKQMTNSKILSYIIGKIFNVYNINFIK